MVVVVFYCVFFERHVKTHEDRFVADKPAGFPLRILTACGYHTRVHFVRDQQ